MSRIIIAFGALLIVTGVVAYFGTGRESVTALLPSFAGVVIVAAGLVASRPATETAGTYAAVGLVVLLALGTLRGLFALLGGDVTVASVLNTVILIASVAFLVYSIRTLRTGESTSTSA